MSTIRTRLAAGAFVLLVGSSAAAQLPFPPNWNNAPVGVAKQSVYPYPGQCWTAAPIGDLPQCTLANAPSFACPAGGGTNQTAFSAACGTVTAAPVVNPIDPATQPKFRWEVLNPPDYTPELVRDAATGALYEYYEIGLHEAQGFQGLASAGLFPNPLLAGGPPVPEGKQWTGLVDAAGAPLFTPIWGVGQINLGGGPITTTLAGLGLFAPGTPTNWSLNNYVATWPSISIRGKTGLPVRVKWVNEFPNTHLFCPHPEAADWPCAIDRTFMGVKATIDPQKAPPTFNVASGVMPYKVNQYGSPQQPDNSWVTHLHGGDIPPSADGFAEKWFGNRTTGAIYAPSPWPLNPVFNAPHSAIEQGHIANPLSRPGGLDGGASDWYFDTYNYPMVNQESTIWFHDHTLGKTHHNVIAGPAGFFPVADPTKHNPIVNGVCTTPNAVDCEYTWLDPLTAPRDTLGIPLYDLFLAVQDRTFSDDGSINFSNGLGQPLVAPPALPNDPAYPACILAGTCTPPGSTPWSPGVNPQVHPVWVPEYIGDHAVVNGVLWPKRTVSPGWYRIRMVDGSDTRCWTLSFQTVEPVYATLATPGSRPIQNVTFTVIANEQGYLPVALPNQRSFSMCPGERYEILVDFGGRAAAYTDPVTGLRVPAGPIAGRQVFMVNSAGAPFPAGLTPQAAGSPFAQMASVMRFDVLGARDPITGAAIPAVPSCPAGQGATWPGSAATPARSCIAIPPQIDRDFVNITGLTDCPKDAAGKPITTGGPCIAAERQLFLNEQVDATTGAPLGMQINGVPFEYDVTETPAMGTYERWKIINLTVDAHPIHPHLVKAQIVNRQTFNKGAYKARLCGSTVCDPAPAVGTLPLLVPDVTPNLTSVPRAPSPFEAGWKDAMVSYPNQVLTFVAKWEGGWRGAAGECAVDDVTCFEPVTAGPYVWHCHINSHEDSEMMRSSLVVK